jgi:hypothetical protein
MIRLVILVACCLLTGSRIGLRHGYTLARTTHDLTTALVLPMQRT